MKQAERISSRRIEALADLLANKQAALEGYDVDADDTPILPFSEDGRIFLRGLSAEGAEKDFIYELDGESGVVREGYVNHINALLLEAGLPGLESDDWFPPTKDASGRILRSAALIASIVGLR